MAQVMLRLGQHARTAPTNRSRAQARTSVWWRWYLAYTISFASFSTASFTVVEPTSMPRCSCAVRRARGYTHSAPSGTKAVTSGSGGMRLLL